jgi:hypothetical protein
MGEAGKDAGDAGKQSIDPLVFDLDGDGIETTGTDTHVVLFDNNGDGVKTGTGWVKPDDGFLVLDRNGNGVIDSGQELFGTDTIKSNGKLATDGFDALRDFDTNKDGKIDAQDSVFADLRVWRDLNQDGISESNELFTLDELGITSINLNAAASNINLGNGNTQSATGSFTRADGSASAVANLNLQSDTFYRQFVNTVTLTGQAKGLPDLLGSGMVRNLSEAISLSPELGDWVQGYAQQTTRQGQIDMLDGFIDRGGLRLQI